MGHTQEKMPKKYDKDLTDKISAMAKEGHTVRFIQKWLQSYGVHMSRQSVWYYAKGLQRTRSAIPTKTTPEVRNLVDTLTRENDELCAAQIRRILKSQHSIDISDSSIRSIRRQLGWSFGPSRIHPMIRDANKEKRVAQARAWLESKEQFDDVIFTDETSVALERYSRLSFKNGTHLSIKSRHPPKVHVWGAISRDGPGPIVISEGIMDKQFFQEQIVLEVLAPYIKKTWSKGHRLFQDNDPMHSTSAAFLLKNGINWVHTPAESPDFNPIETVWALMKSHIRKVAKPKNKEQLIEAIKNFWYNQLTKETCNDVIDHLLTVLPIVIERNGLGHWDGKD